MTTPPKVLLLLYWIAPLVSPGVPPLPLPLDAEAADSPSDWYSYMTPVTGRGGVPSTTQFVPLHPTKHLLAPPPPSILHLQALTESVRIAIPGLVYASHASGTGGDSAHCPALLRSSN